MGGAPPFAELAAALFGGIAFAVPAPAGRALPCCNRGDEEAQAASQAQKDPTPRVLALPNEMKVWIGPTVGLADRLADWLRCRLTDWSTRARAHSGDLPVGQTATSGATACASPQPRGETRIHPHASPPPPQSSRFNVGTLLVHLY